MNEYKSKVDNSYESSSSGSASSNSVGDTNAHYSMNFDANEGHTLTTLLLPTGVVTGNMEYEIYNTSAEEGIFPNIQNCSIAAPSYDPEYDYYNQYSTTPLVYSWLPIVPGFTKEGTDNLHNFEHIIKRQHPQPLNVSNAEDDDSSTVISDQNIKFETSLVMNNSDQRLFILNNSNGMTFNHQHDDSCNAMDLNISHNKENYDHKLDLSFNGKIKFPDLTPSPKRSKHVEEITKYFDKAEQIEEVEVNTEKVWPDQFLIIKDEPLKETITNNNNNNNYIDDEINEKEKTSNNDDENGAEEEESDGELLRNESFELLKREDSKKMLLLNEKSPEAADVCDSQDEANEDEQQTDITPTPQQTQSEINEIAEELDEVEEELNVVEKELNEVENELKEVADETKNELNEVEEETKESEVDERVTNKCDVKTLKECDDFIFNKLQISLSEHRPPPSITTLPLSLSEMLTTYRKNLEKSSESFAEVKNCSLFVPSHPINEVIEKQWPEIMEVRAQGIIYNRSINCEEIEVMCMRFGERLIKAETSSSFNHRIGPTSAKKRNEKLKLLTQSPGSRLSHLANRRKIFSSANLKSTSGSSQTNKTLSGQILIDKTKLYQKRKRTSAKKKTPGKRKTPKSAKRQLQIIKPPPSATTSKRALFTSPAHSKNFLNDENVRLSRSISSFSSRGVLPKRSLFSPVQNAKRKRSPSPDQDVENRFGKNRRLESPSRLMKSKSFSIAAPSSSGSLDEHFKKTLFYRTQSDMVLNQSAENSSSKSNLGFRKPMSETEKKKLLWTASSVLQAKQINRDHAKFKEYMSTLCKLVKRIFTEFYNPSKSMSAQMTKFSNLMVYYIIQGRPLEEIFVMTKHRLEVQNPTKVSGYIAQDEYEKNSFIRKNSSLLLMTNSCSSLNLTDNSNSFIDSNFDKTGSDTSLNHSTSKNNNDSGVLRENVLVNSRVKSSKKLFGGSDSSLHQLKTSTPSSNVLKAKRQISF